MPVVYVPLGIFLVTACWSLWVRRDTIHSRWDAPLTCAVGLLAVSAVLASPWPPIAAASFPLTGKYYLPLIVGNFTCMTAAVLLNQGIYQRLLPDNVVGPFIRNRVMPVVIVVGVITLACAVASPLTSTMPAASLYFIEPDGWLSWCWGLTLAVLTLLALAAIYGLIRLRKDRRQETVELHVAALTFGLITIPSLSFAVDAGRPDVAELLVWPIAYASFTVIALAAGISWRRRVAEMSRQQDKPQFPPPQS